MAEASDASLGRQEMGGKCRSGCRCGPHEGQSQLPEECGQRQQVEV